MKLQDWLESLADDDTVVTIVRPRRGEWHATLWTPLGFPVHAKASTLLDALQTLKTRLEA